MITRFQKEEGKKRLFKALMEHDLIKGDVKVAKFVLENSELKQFETGHDIIKQDEFGSDLYFIISGSADVVINGRVITKKTAGEHFGEMALIDTTAKRSATIKAVEQTVVAILSEENFSEIANKNPKLWRKIAVTLSKRLLERTTFHRYPNKNPMILLQSSKEVSSITERVKKEMNSENLIITTWSESIFQASATVMQGLCNVISDYDFGIVILGNDMLASSREKNVQSLRDSAVFTLGLVLGSFGRNRTFILKPKGLDIKIPSDQLGLECLEYDPSPEKSEKSIKSICTKLRSQFLILGAK